MSKLPEQLQKQVNAAETYYKPAETKPVEASTGDNPEGVEVSTTDVNNEVRTSPVTAQKNVEDENSDTYARRWHSQQGIVSSLNSKVSNYEQRINQLEQLIANMQTEPAKTQEKVKFLTEKDTEEYGPEMVDFVNRAVSEGTSNLRTENEQLKQQLQRLSGVVPVVQNVVNQQHQDKENVFWNYVNTGVPELNAINSNPKFHEWLAASDPNTGIMRDVYLKDAQRDLDANRVISIFNSWQQLNPVTDNRSTSNQRKMANELEMQVAPGTKNSQTNTQQRNDAKQWARTDIAKFYDDVRRGVYKGKDDQRAQVEGDIFQAQRDNRVAA